MVTLTSAWTVVSCVIYIVHGTSLSLFCKDHMGAITIKAAAHASKGARRALDALPTRQAARTAFPIGSPTVQQEQMAEQGSTDDGAPPSAMSMPRRRPSVLARRVSDNLEDMKKAKAQLPTLRLNEKAGSFVLREVN